MGPGLKFILWLIEAVRENVRRDSDRPNLRRIIVLSPDTAGRARLVSVSTVVNE